MNDQLSQNIPLVSVIIPSYNHLRYIEEAVLSVIKQTYQNVELIVLDDGSTDGSVALLKELVLQHDFSLIVKENEGLSATLNKGIELAKGKYICVCASDDILLLDKLEKQVSFMEEHSQYMIGYGKKINFYPNGVKKPIQNKHYRSGHIFKDLILFDFFISPVSVIYRKEVFAHVGGFSIDLAVEDVDMFLRIANHFEIGFQDEYFYYYRVHGQNTVGDVEKMERNTNAILAKWKGSEYYQTALRNKNLLYFRNYTLTDKWTAISRLPLHPMVLKKKAFYHGLLLLIMPRFVYNFLKGSK